MSSGWEVLWTATAQADLEEIINFIATENLENAQRILVKIKATSASLSCCPEPGRYIPELESQGIYLYRELVVDKWRIMYRIDNSRVLLLSVLDSRRNLEDILLHRFMRH